MSQEENKKLMRRTFDEIWNQGKLEVADEINSPDYLDHGLPPGLSPGNEGWKQNVSMTLAAFPDLHFTIEDQVAEGDKEVTRYTARGTHQGEFWGIPPTGKSVEVNGMAITRIVDGQCVEGWGLWDRLGLLVQFGAVDMPI